MNTLHIDNNATLSSTGLATKIANAVIAFFKKEQKTESNTEAKGHSFLDQATRLGCDMSHFNHIS
mgnify:CR=1 FL=1|jgi:hypothetical protein